MADLKISQLTGATTPLAGTEVLPIVQSSTTKKVATDDLTVRNVRAKATTGILQVAGPTAGTTRTMTTPDADFTAARTDAAQTFTGVQTFSSNPVGVKGVANLGPGSGTDFKSGGTYMAFVTFPVNVTVTSIDYQYVQAVQDNILEVFDYKVGSASAVTIGTYTGTAAGTRSATWTGSQAVTAGTRFYVGPNTSSNGNQSNVMVSISYTS